MEPQNPIDRRTVLAFVLMFAVWFGWMAIFSPDPKSPSEEEPAPTVVDAPPPVLVEGEGEQPVVEAPQLSDEAGRAARETGWVATDADERGEPIEVRTPLYVAHIDPVGGDLLRWELTRFDKVDGSPVQLVGSVTTDVGTQYAHALRLVYEDRSIDLRKVIFEPDRSVVVLRDAPDEQVLTLRARHADGTSWSCATDSTAIATVSMSKPGRCHRRRPRVSR